VFEIRCALVVNSGLNVGRRKPGLAVVIEIT
jgi:hypothetical protein